MKVHGVDIPDGTENAAWRELGPEFDFPEVQGAVERVGQVPREVKRGASTFPISMRAADRMLQKWRKHGQVSFDRSRRVWTKSAN